MPPTRACNYFLIGLFSAFDCLRASLSTGGAQSLPASTTTATETATATSAAAMMTNGKICCLLLAVALISFCS